MPIIMAAIKTTANTHRTRTSQPFSQKIRRMLGT